VDKYISYGLFILQLTSIFVFWKYLGFWWMCLILFIVYTVVGLYFLYREPYMIYVFEMYAHKWEGAMSDAWYARLARYIGKPIYWVVDKAKENYEKRNEDE